MMISRPVLRQVLRQGFLALLLLALASCRSYVFLPVDVAYEKISPPYVLSFVNETGAAFEVRPSESGRHAGYPSVQVPPGGDFRALLQLRRFTVGSGSAVAGAQVYASPYFEQAGADQAEVIFFQREQRSQLVSLAHPSWFDEYEQPSPSARVLVVTLKDFPLVPLFPRGPLAGP